MLIASSLVILWDAVSGGNIDSDKDKPLNSTVNTGIYLAVTLYRCMGYRS